jgi:hypothetical protein
VCQAARQQTRTSNKAQSKTAALSPHNDDDDDDDDDDS